MTRIEYVDYRVANMSIAEAKEMNEWELAGESALVWDHIHSTEFACWIKEETGIELDSAMIDSIFDFGLEEGYEAIISFIQKSTYDDGFDIIADRQEENRARFGMPIF